MSTCGPPSTTTTTTQVASSTSTTTTTTLAQGCTGYASFVAGTSNIFVYGSCQQGMSGTRVEIRIVDEMVGLVSSATNDQCAVTSSSFGTNDVLGCDGAFAFSLGGTVPFGTITVSPPLGASGCFTAYLSIFQGPTQVLGPYPVNCGG